MTQYCHLDKRTTLETIPTPALVLDLDTLEANVEAMERLVGPTGKRIRPHVKTHRTTEIARHQIGGHAWGVTCATVGEVEAMAAAGIDDLLLANEVVDADKLERLALVAKNASVTLAVDDAEAVAAMSQFATRVGVTIGVLIDVDIHLHRCGVSSAADAVRLASIIEGSAGLRLMGIMGYEGRLRSKVERRAEKIASAYAILSEVRDAMQRKGFDVGIVSAGGTSTLVEALADPVITEVQAGVYCLMEPDLSGMSLPFSCAVVLLGTVISRHPGRVVVNAGRRSVGMEYGPPVPKGFEAQAIRVSDEHITFDMPGISPELGARLAFTPAQIRTTFNLHDHVWVRRGADLVDRWPIAGRCKFQQGN
jgi:D-serine deaminase-like pyridoxal phosphate-dependent protein